MTLAFDKPIRGAELFSLEPDGPMAGKPGFMNRKAVPHVPKPHQPEALRGPGIYGIFLRDRLFYVGIYTGARGTPFTGTVVERWERHLTYQTLRSPEVAFSPSAMREVLQLPGAPIDAIAAELGGRDVAVESLDPTSCPLIAGGSCTANKARFATQHWDTFGPGQEARMLEEVSFVYRRLLPEPDVLMLLGDAEGRVRKNWVKYQWLAVRETELVRRLQPACNPFVDPVRAAQHDVDPATFIEELRAQLQIPLTPFGAAAATRAGPNESVEDDIPDAIEQTDMQPGEEQFRERLSEAGDMLASQLREMAPAGMRLGFTKSDMRLYIEPSHKVLLELGNRKGGQLLVQTPASVAACTALGLQAEANPAGWSRFLFDPEKGDVATLLAVAGAALEAIC